MSAELTPGVIVKSSDRPRSDLRRGPRALQVLRRAAASEPGQQFALRRRRGPKLAPAGLENGDPAVNSWDLCHAPSMSLSQAPARKARRSRSPLSEGAAFSRMVGLRT